MASVTDILHFYTKGKKSENDMINRIREKALLVLNDIKHSFFTDAENGKKWQQLRIAFEKYLNDILNMRGISKKMVSYKLLARGNLDNHHDFDIEINLGDTIEKICFEFKFNSMPQFANEYDKHRFIPVTLAEYWYDNGILDKIIALYPTLRIAKPSREEYLTSVTQPLNSKSRDSFFKQFYDWEHTPAFDKKSKVYKERSLIVKQGINDYTTKHGQDFMVDKLATKFQAEQVEKIYGVWNPSKSEFKVHIYSADSLCPTKVSHIKNKNCIVLKTKDNKSEIHCLLRWKNTQGICMPAWQISMKT